MLGALEQTTLSALEQTIKFAQRRHETLAGNIANMDTPGYIARDLSVTDFQEALAEAIESPHRRSPGMVGSETDPMKAAQRAMENLLYHDESKVNLERQVTEISKNQHMHNTAIALMRNQFAQLRVAISERV